MNPASPTGEIPQRIVIATRQSPLALWQANHVRDRLRLLYPDCQLEILAMTTRGDQILDRPLNRVGGKGLFVKELETALLDGRADIAVHSMKDIPMDLGPEFAIVATGSRESPFDAFVSNRYPSLDAMPPSAIVGTSSLRREAQLRAAHPALVVNGLRGNLETRLRRLDAGDYDAIILAAAGLTRLGLGARIRAVLPAEVSLPAAGQGALGIEALSRRPEVASWTSAFDDAECGLCIRAERAVSRALAGNCDLPLGAYAEFSGEQIRLRGFVASRDGRRVASAEMRAAPNDPESLGIALAAKLRARGADQILATLES